MIRGKCPNCGGPASACVTKLTTRPLVFAGNVHKGLTARAETSRELSRYYFCETCGYQDNKAGRFKP